MLKPAFSRRFVRENITKNRAFVARKNLKPLENVNIINVHIESLAASVRDFVCFQNRRLMSQGKDGEKGKKKNIVIAFFSRVSKLLFNKIFYVALSMIAQIAWFVLLFIVLMRYSPYITIVIEIMAVLTVLRIVNRYINPSYKLAWSITILAIPVFGLTLYLLLGQSRFRKAMARRIVAVDREGVPSMQQDRTVRLEMEKLDAAVSNQSSYIADSSGYPVYRDTSAEYFQVGEDMFPVLVRELDKAEKYIFIEYFIINDGVMWETILDILIRKARQGVDVRLIYDGFGCLATLPSGYYKKMREMGIQCVVFNPFRPILNIVANNRDHRKICVIDGWTGFTGGINLADEYINRKNRFGHWKDAAVMLKGGAVWSMTVMFLKMWSVINREDEPIPYQDYRPDKADHEPVSSSGFVQPFSDSPLDNETVSEYVYLNIIHHAKKYVYICTPYLIIDNEMITALSLAAKSGVDVRIMTPGTPDKKLVFLLTQSYYEQLLMAGVRIYVYQPGFLHSKSIVCDDELAVVGTINLDYRSMYLHFEDGVWMYRNNVVHEIRQDFMDTLDVCEKVSLEFCRDRKWPVKAMQGLLRLVAPML